MTTQINSEQYYNRSRSRSNDQCESRNKSSLDIIRMYRKNTIPQIIKHNQEEHEIEQKTESAPKTAVTVNSIPLRMIDLPQIHFNLYLSNAQVFEQPEIIAQEGIHVIVNLSENMQQVRANYLWTDRHSKHIFHPTFRDSKNITCTELQEILQCTNTMLRNHLDHKPVLVVCEKGVNRSVAIVIGYAMMEKRWSFDQAMAYIDAMKLDKYPGEWQSLNNPQIRNALNALQPPPNTAVTSEMTE